ncbi:ParA family partition ATPase [Amaricoccus tamworthensis]|uniref:ParA family partition ATPase n=1 Tax=Amaricoccus tamworthensis TaxID=57002 RepID=UPI003C7C5EC2
MGQVITFAQQKGGAGKTTVLAHLAAAWSRAGKSVAVMDLDPQQSLAQWAKLRNDEGVEFVESKDYRASSDMRSCRKKYDLTLVDCPGAAATLLDNVIRETDLVVAPVQPSAMDIWASRTIIETSTKNKTPCRLLLNRVPPRFNGADDLIATVVDGGGELLDTRLGNRIAYSRSIMTGQSAQEISPRSLAASEISGLAKEIEALLKI